MALVIHRPTEAPVQERPLMLLVGGDGRWVRPLRLLAERLGFSTSWQQDERLAARTLKAPDLVLVADSEAGEWILRHRAIGAQAPLVVLTGSLLGLSVPLSAEATAVAWPITRDHIEMALRLVEESAPRPVAQS